MNKLLVIDGNAVMHRAYHAIPPFKTKAGIPTNALYGFFSILHKGITDFNPSHVIISFDTPAKTFREKMYEEYQAQRPKVEDDFITQIPMIRRAVQIANIVYLEKDGYEGDDIIGTVSRKFAYKSNKVFIFSGDKDIIQLVDDNTYVISPRNSLSKNILYDATLVKQRFSVAPSQMPELKGLMGDPSDNYPGAKGIGPKTATNLIVEFGSIKNLYQNLNKIKNERIRKILVDNKNNVFLSKKLATILTDVDVKVDFKKAEFNNFNTELKTYLLGFEMYSLANRLFKKNSKTNSETNNQKLKTNEPQHDQFKLF